ncbi:MAG: hypothetical protein R3F47_08420 [Gammaproteobacteria bacterium]
MRSFSVEREEELFIEVKTTNSGKYQPFYVSIMSCHSQGILRSNFACIGFMISGETYDCLRYQERWKTTFH